MAGWWAGWWLVQSHWKTRPACTVSLSGDHTTSPDILISVIICQVKLLLEAAMCPVTIYSMSQINKISIQTSDSVWWLNIHL